MVWGDWVRGLIPPRGTNGPPYRDRVLILAPAHELLGGRFVATLDCRQIPGRGLATLPFEMATLVRFDESSVLKFAEEFHGLILSDPEYLGSLAVAERDLAVVIAVVAFQDFYEQAACRKGKAVPGWAIQHPMMELNEPLRTGHTEGMESALRACHCRIVRFDPGPLQQPSQQHMLAASANLEFANGPPVASTTIFVVGRGSALDRPTALLLIEGQLWTILGV